MRVAVKNMRGVFIHSTTPRKARLLLKEKKAVIESNNPFTIRLLFLAGECGLKDSESLNKLNSGLLPEKDITMFENEETNGEFLPEETRALEKSVQSFRDAVHNYLNKNKNIYINKEED